MKWLLIFTFLLYLWVPRASAQKLIFCENVDISGKVSGASDVFTIGNTGGYFQLLVNMPGVIGSRHVLFDVYRIDPGTQQEIFENSIRVPVDPGWTWFKKEVTFYKKGDYVVYVYNDKDQLISAGKVKILIE
jgi:hypothetical protein